MHTIRLWLIIKIHLTKHYQPHLTYDHVKDSRLLTLHYDVQGDGYGLVKMGTKIGWLWMRCGFCNVMVNYYLVTSLNVFIVLNRKLARHVQTVQYFVDPSIHPYLLLLEGFVD